VLLWIVVGLCSTILGLVVVLHFRASLDLAWNDARLAPTMGMIYGVPLWLRHGQGPVLDMIYGPVAALTWLPAALQSTPTLAIGVGVLEALLLTLVPAAWIVWTEGHRDRALMAATLLMGVAMVLSSPVFSTFHIHADVPALGYATIAIACAWTDCRRKSAFWRWAGAAAVVAAIGSKQVILPLAVIYPAWIFLASGHRTGVRATASVATVGALALAVVWATVDTEAMLAATLVGPNRHPWMQADAAAALRWALGDMVQRLWPTAALLALGTFVVWRPSPSWAARARAHRWLFPLAVGVACMPTALVGRMKLGGSPNTLAFTIWFVWLALVAAYASSSRRPPAARRVLTVVALMVAGGLALRLAPQLEGLPRLLGRAPGPSVAFDAARRAPGTIYFPYRPTVTFLAEGRGYHVDSGLFFRELEGLPIDGAFVRRFLPPQIERIADDRQFFPPTLRYLPEFRRQVLDPHLPGWIVLEEYDVPMPPATPQVMTEFTNDPSRLPVAAAAPPSALVDLRSIEMSVPVRERRPHVRIDAVAHQSIEHELLEIELLLLDEQGEHLLTLAAHVVPGADGAVAAEWPIYFEILRSAARGTAIVRSGTWADGSRWRLSATAVRQAAGFRTEP
jgi:hypothetical protein